MKRPSPLVQMTMALVALASTLVILGSLFLNVVPDRGAQQRAVRAAVGEALALQLAESLQRDEPAVVLQWMVRAVARTDALRSAGVRRSDGSLMLDSGEHAQRWKPMDGDASRPEQVIVPLMSQGRRWGQVELAFQSDAVHPVLAFFQEPLVQMLLFISAGGWLVFGLYMRRALQHLDPSSVVPERVQGAFDAMAEGVVVLDARGRMMMCNRAFRQLHPELAAMLPGRELSTLPWLAAALPADVTQHPWNRAMAERTGNAGAAYEAGEGDDRRQLVFNAAPVCDAGGTVRGCMVTINDQSELHQANTALRDAMQLLEQSKREVDAKNIELERLATRDPMTGALNRRAYHAAFERVVNPASGPVPGVACIMLDIDHFKSINDTHGHGIGDRVIQEVARKLSTDTRGDDLLCRWGGEEFSLLAIGMDADQAMDLAERVRAHIERDVGPAVREIAGLRVTASVGVAMLEAPQESLLALVERADQRLYEAKRGGRNRVVGPRDASARSAPDGAADPGTADRVLLDGDAWSERWAELRREALAKDSPLSCVVLAADRWPEVVREHGAPAGAALTAAVAAWALESAPAAALVGQLDDRRVAIAMVGVGPEASARLADRVRRRAEQSLHTALPGTEAGALRISAGVDTLPASAPGVAMLAERAEQALVRARRAGGNRIEHFSTPQRRSTAPAEPR